MFIIILLTFYFASCSPLIMLSRLLLQSTPLLVCGAGGSNDAQGKVLIPILVSIGGRQALASHPGLLLLLLEFL